jgi:DNA-binding protein
MKYYVSVTTSYPKAYVEEVVEVEANSSEEAEELVLEGDGYQISTNIQLGEVGEEKIVDVVDITDLDI